MCRGEWAQNILEALKGETDAFRKKQQALRRQREKEESKQRGEHTLYFTINGKRRGIIKDKRFKCFCCKRTLYSSFESRLHCLICRDLEVCELCHKGGFHSQHPFIIKKPAETEWEGYQVTKLKEDETLHNHFLMQLQVLPYLFTL